MTGRGVVVRKHVEMELKMEQEPSLKQPSMAVAAAQDLPPPPKAATPMHAQWIVHGMSGHGENAPNPVEMGHKMEQDQLHNLQNMEAANAQDHPMTCEAVTPFLAQIAT